MEVDLHARVDLQGAAGVHHGVAVDHVGLVVGPGHGLAGGVSLVVQPGDDAEIREPGDGPVRPEDVGVLTPGHQQHLLLVAVGVEEDAVLHDEGGVHPALSGQHFHEHEEAVAAKDLHLAEGEARGAVHVDAVGAGRAALQRDVHPHGLVVAVAHGEALGDRGGERGEDGVEEHGVPAELQAGAGVVGELLVLAAGRQHGHGQQEQEGCAQELQGGQRCGIGGITADRPRSLPEGVVGGDGKSSYLCGP